MAEGPISELRATDPLLACIGQLAERLGVSFAPSMFSGLARDGEGRLPLHQAEPALELLGLNCEPCRGRPSCRARPEPIRPSSRWRGKALSSSMNAATAICWSGGRDWRHRNGNRWTGSRPAIRAGWPRCSAILPPCARPASRGKLRRAAHWFWSELNKLRGQFWPVLVGFAADQSACPGAAAVLDERL